MKNSVHTCDRCGKTADTDLGRTSLDLATVTVGTEITNYYSNNTRTVQPKHSEWTKEWCHACREELGVLVQWSKTPEQAAKLPTLEDMLRELIQEEIGAQS